MNIIFGIFIVILVLALLYLWMICPSLSKKLEMKTYDKQCFAHRGYFSESKLIPENSMLAFKEAVKHHYGIELDVHLTKDHQVVVFHDDTLERMCNVQNSIEHMTYKELQMLHLQNTSERIPLLSEVLTYVNGRVPILIELKLPTRSLTLCDYTYKLLKTYQGPYLVQSFNTLALHWFKANAPAVLRGQLSSDLLKSKGTEPIILKFLVQHLMINWYGRPHFISYKLADADNLSVRLNQHLFHVPIAVWTLHTKKAFEKGKSNYDMMIFERFLENN